MSAKLFFGALVIFALGIILIGLLIFLPAGSFAFTNGWVFMGILFIPILIAGVVMMITNPSLLEKRLESKEKQKEQNIIVKLSGLMFIAGFLIYPALIAARIKHEEALLEKELEGYSEYKKKVRYKLIPFIY